MEKIIVNIKDIVQTDDPTMDMYECPNCKELCIYISQWNKTRDNYCSDCGAKIKWEEK